MKVILSLDLSTKPGWAVAEGAGDEIRLLGYGTNFNLKEAISGESELPQDFRYLKNANRVADFVEELVLKWEPDEIWVEQTNAGAFRSSQKQLEFIHCRLLQKLNELGQEHRLRYADTSAWRRTCSIRLSKEQKLHNRAVKQKKTEGRDKKIRGRITSKHLAVEFVNKMFGLNLLIKDNDAADALAICVHALKTPKQQPQITADILDKALS